MSEPTILIVDDEPNILRALMRLLRKEGYHLLSAGNGEAGLECLRETSVDVVVSDFRMPGMTGLEFLMEARDIAPDAVRVILSGYMDVGLITDAVNRGEIYRFITKPWDDDELKALIRQSVQHCHLVRENRRLNEELQQTNRELLELNHRLEEKVEERTKELFIHNKALLLSQEVLDNLPTAVVGVDGDGTVVLTNRAAGDQLASSSGESGAAGRPVIGAAFAECLPSSVIGPIEEAMAEKARIHIGQTRIGDRSADVHVVPMGSESQGRGVILVAHDITQHVAAEEEDVASPCAHRAPPVWSVGAAES